MSLEFPYFVIEHFENKDFPADGWCCREYLNILRVATPARVIVTNISKENQEKLHPEFKLCAAISEHSMLDYVYNKDDINNAPTTPQVLRELAYYHHNNFPLTTIPSTTESSSETTPPLPPTTTSTTSTPDQPSQICFLDEFGTGPLEPTDLGVFRYIMVGGILGDHPSTDRGGHLRNHGFSVRHLGPRQMSTDTAVLACCAVLRHGIHIPDLESIDDAEVFEDEIDKIPLKEQIAKGQAKKKQLRKMRESTSIRMRYLTHQQDKLDGTSFEVPRDIITIDRSRCDNEVNTTPMAQFPCFCDCPECGAQRIANGNNNCNVNHAGDWYHSRTQPQINLHNETQTRIARITPGLLEHIFNTLDDGLIDLDGQLDIDFEAMALGIDEAEDKALCDILFFD